MSTILEPAVETRVEPSVREVLHRAADLIEEFGHHKGYYACDAAGVVCEARQSRAVAFCIAGATDRALADFGSDEHGHDFLLELRAFDSNFTIWNDAPERTSAEVVSLLREAAEASS